MPIAQSEIKVYKSSNGVGLGGAIDLSTEVVDAALNNIFAPVTSAQAMAGITLYRCVYIRNTNTLIDLLNSGIELTSDTPNNTTEIAIGLGTSTIDAPEQTIPNETTAPSGVSFQSSLGTVLTKGTLPANGSYYAIWLRYTIDANALASASDDAVFTIVGDVTQ